MANKDAAVVHLEHQSGQGISADDAEFLSNFSDEAKKKVLRKVSAMLSGIKKFTDKVHLDRRMYSSRSRSIDPENDD
jgi:hypothetical protein